MTMRHEEKKLLEAVLVIHQQNASSGCRCGWGPLGESWARHVADRYEAALGGSG